jgi:hypothetical protein
LSGPQLKFGSVAKPNGYLSLDYRDSFRPSLRSSNAQNRTAVFDLSIGDFDQDLGVW